MLTGAEAWHSPVTAAGLAANPAVYFDPAPHVPDTRIIERLVRGDIERRPSIAHSQNLFFPRYGL